MLLLEQQRGRPEKFRSERQLGWFFINDAVEAIHEGTINYLTCFRWCLCRNICKRRHPLRTWWLVLHIAPAAIFLRFSFHVDVGKRLIVFPFLSSKVVVICHLWRDSNTERYARVSFWKRWVGICVCAKGWFSLSVISLCPGFCTTMPGLVIGCKRISCRAVFFFGPIMLCTLLQF